MAEFAVEMQDVLKQFITPEGGVLSAVNHVTMQIKDGEFFSLLGPSGCGKTTSLRMIAGFELPTGGKIFIHGKEMSQHAAQFPGGLNRSRCRRSAGRTWRGRSAFYSRGGRRPGWQCRRRCAGSERGLDLEQARET